MPIFALTNAAVQPHVELFVRLKSRCNWIHEWHLMLHRHVSAQRCFFSSGK